MTPNTKKIIAREGLILLVFMVASAVSFLAFICLPEKETVYSYEIDVHGTKYNYQSSLDIFFNKKETIISNAAKEQGFADPFKQDELKSQPQLSIDESAKQWKKEREREEAGELPEGLSLRLIESRIPIINQLRWICFYFAMLLWLVIYPCYWLTHFIVWAIKILRG